MTPVHSSFPHPGADSLFISHIFASHSFRLPCRDVTLGEAHLVGRSQTLRSSVKRKSGQISKLQESPWSSLWITDCSMAIEGEGGDGGRGSCDITRSFKRKKPYGITSLCTRVLQITATCRFRQCTHLSIMEPSTIRECKN